MFFGEFLVQQKLITKDRLLFALICQQERQSCFLRVLQESNVLSKEQMLELSKGKWETKKSLVSLLREQNLVDESQVQFILKRQQESRKLIGQYLIELGAISEKDLLQSYDRYVAENSNKASTQIYKDIEFLEWQEMDPEIVHEYGEILNLEKIGEIEQLVLDWEKDPQSETLRSFFRELHTIKGTARFIKAGLSEKLIHRMEELVSNLIRASDLLKQEELSVYADCFLKGLDQIVRIKAHVLENKQERSFWSDQHKQDSLKSYLQALDETIQLSQKLLEKIDMNTFNDRF